MSRIESYGCDCCGVIQPEAVMTGVGKTEDLFDKLKSYPVIMNPGKAEIHFCHDCYNDKVLMPARVTVDRKNNEDAYKRVIADMTLNLRQLCVRNWREKKFFKKLE